MAGAALPARRARRMADASGLSSVLWEGEGLWKSAAGDYRGEKPVRALLERDETKAKNVLKDFWQLKL